MVTSSMLYRAILSGSSARAWARATVRIRAWAIVGLGQWLRLRSGQWLGLGPWQLLGLSPDRARAMLGNAGVQPRAMLELGPGQCWS